jgi:primary-amine oxidase
MTVTMRSSTRRGAPEAVLSFHPLDPLSLEEVRIATQTVRRERGLGEAHRFPLTRLEEPTRAEIKAWEGGADLQRIAFVLVLDRQTGEAFEAFVDVRVGALVRTRALAVHEPPYGQPPVMIEEFARCEKIVKADPAWRRAVMRRGLSEAELDLVQVDPFSSGFFDRDFERGRRIVRAVCYWRENLQDNAYAHPIEGVVAVVDLIAEKVVDLVDAPEIVPVPKKKRNYHRDDLPAPREDLKPLDIVQPQGASFKVDGWKVDWQKWSFRVGFNPREGLVLHQIAYDDDGRKRRIIHRASITDMVVPYADPTANHYWKSAFDAGEYGLGRLANSLELGCDCLGHIYYFDVAAADDGGEPFLMKNVICMHEEDYGVLWKHYEFRAGIYEVRRSRRLVISFFVTVGNYDYGFYWYLYQDGSIQLEAKLTGIVQTAAVAPGKTYRFGGMIDENLGGPTHQHFFNARLHMDIDGGGNSVTEHEFQPRPMGGDNPHGNVFDTTSRTLQREQDAIRVADGASGRYWKIVNPNVVNSVGNPTGYKLIVQGGPVMLAQDGSSARRRGAFATKHLWVTPFHPDEKYATGDYPNVHAGGDGLARYVAHNRPIENTDIVVWHSFGHTHVCKPEDFPVMPVEHTGFILRPNGFFSANAASDVAADANTSSVDARTGGAEDGSSRCCD